MQDKEFDPHQRTVPLEKRRGGGRPLPRPAGSKPQKWQPPNNDTTADTRKKQNSDQGTHSHGAESIETINGDKGFDPHQRTVPLEKRRGGGRPLPRPAGGKVKKWQPPTGGTTPADRKKPKADRDA